MALSNLFIRIINSFTGNANDACLAFFMDSITNAAQSTISDAINFYGYNFYNPNTVDCYIKLWEGVPVIGIDTPFDILQVPAGGSIVLFGSDAMFHATSLHITATSGYDYTNNANPTIPLQGFFKYKN